MGTIAVFQILLSQEADMRKAYETTCNSRRSYARLLENKLLSLESLLQEEKMRTLALSHVVSLPHKVA